VTVHGFAEVFALVGVLVWLVLFYTIIILPASSVTKQKQNPLSPTGKSLSPGFIGPDRQHRCGEIIAESQDGDEAKKIASHPVDLRNPTALCQEGPLPRTPCRADRWGRAVRCRKLRCRQFVTSRGFQVLAWCDAPRSSPSASKLRSAFLRWNERQHGIWGEKGLSHT
jgi:hypothetical protein